MNIVRLSNAREFATPGATMTTLASPTLGGSTLLSLWKVRMSAGQAGPEHIIDSEQIWSLTSGDARITVDGSEVKVSAGDSFVISGGSIRRIESITECEFLVCGFAKALATAQGGDAKPASPPWVH